MVIFQYPKLEQAQSPIFHDFLVTYNTRSFIDIQMDGPPFLCIFPCLIKLKPLHSVHLKVLAFVLVFALPHSVRFFIRKGLIVHF